MDHVLWVGSGLKGRGGGEQQGGVQGSRSLSEVRGPALSRRGYDSVGWGIRVDGLRAGGKPRASPVAWLVALLHGTALLVCTASLIDKRLQGVGIYCVGCKQQCCQPLWVRNWCAVEPLWVTVRHPVCSRHLNVYWSSQAGSCAFVESYHNGLKVQACLTTASPFAASIVGKPAPERPAQPWHLPRLAARLVFFCSRT